MKRRLLFALLFAGTMSEGLITSAADQISLNGCPPTPCIPEYSTPYNPCQPSTMQGSDGAGSGLVPTPLNDLNATSPQTAMPTVEPNANPDAVTAPPAPVSDLSNSVASLPASRSISSGLAYSGGGVSDNVGGYIDDAVIRTRFRMRYDSVDGGDSDRAEFLYASYNPAAVNGVGLLVQSTAPGLIAPRRLDYEEVTSYLEVALTPKFALFGELGVRWNDADPIPGSFNAGAGGDLQASGLGDMNVGFKYALRRTQFDALTFQFKVLIPTADEAQLLGTGHVSLMPGLLYRERVSQRVTLFGELQDWIAVGTSEITGGQFAGEDIGGNVLRYGIGVGYDLYQGQNRERLTLVNEFVGWTVLDGYGVLPRADLTNADFADMSGDTIFNIKSGLRYNVGLSSLYVGYGFAVTDDVWYDDIIRVQFERFF